MLIDPNPFRDEQGVIVVANQLHHVKRYNALGRVMASAGDIYRAGRGTVDYLFAGLQEDFEQGSLITSTHISYEKRSLRAKIIDNWKSTVAKPQERSVQIPVYDSYSGTSLKEVLDTEDGTLYLQILFNTADNSQQLKKTLQDLSDQTSRSIYVHTPDLRSRKFIREIAIQFCYNVNGFHISGNLTTTRGRSREVT